MGRAARRFVQRLSDASLDFFTPELLIGKLHEAGLSLLDNRKGNNLQYQIEDVLKSAFSVFFTQCPSFLSYQEAMEQKFAMNNARNLFGIQKIPSDQQVRNILDPVSPVHLFPVFQWCFEQVSKSGLIKRWQTPLGYMVAMDGTQYFSSAALHCKNCLTKTSEKTGKVTYYHSAITPVIVKPGSEHVLSLTPEFIVPQDGYEKQDCENAAAKRWVTVYAKQLLSLPGENKPTLLGDDLYAHVPFCRKALSTGLNFILVCKPESHKTVYAWIKGITEEYVEDRFDGKRHLLYTYNYVEKVPLKDMLKKGEEQLLVNFVEVTVRERETGKQVYHSAFITNHPLTDEALPAIVDCGRARWKIENENNNTLKTKGYYFEHNYGHGENYLSSLLVTLILMSFLFHTLLDMTNQAYQKVRELLHARVRFFNDIKTLTKYSCYRNWKHLFAWMEHALTKGQHLPNFTLPPPLTYTAD